MLIVCPICGPRGNHEFTYLGDATKVRPDDSETDAAMWSDYVFERRNPRGVHIEHWQHSAGCRSVLKVERSTVSHAITGVALEGPWG